MKSGIELIAQERKEQIEKHGYTVERDVATNCNHQLVDAATDLIFFQDPLLMEKLVDNPPDGWNREIWAKMCRKPYVERLALAGAFIAAELDIINYLGEDE